MHMSHSNQESAQKLQKFPLHTSEHTSLINLWMVLCGFTLDEYYGDSYVRYVNSARDGYMLSFASTGIISLKQYLDAQAVVVRARRPLLEDHRECRTLKQVPYLLFSTKFKNWIYDQNAKAGALTPLRLFADGKRARVVRAK